MPADALICSHPRSGGRWLRYLIAHYLEAHHRLGLEVTPQAVFAVVPDHHEEASRGYPAYRFMDRREVPLVAVWAGSLLILVYQRDLGASLLLFLSFAALLYAGLTARWPGTVGSAVPDSPRDNGRPLRPRQVRAGVPRPLDTICERVLGSDEPGGSPGLATAHEIYAALCDFIGDPSGGAPVEFEPTAFFDEAELAASRDEEQPSAPAESAADAGPATVAHEAARDVDPEATVAGHPWATGADPEATQAAPMGGANRLEGAPRSRREAPSPPPPFPPEEPRPLFASDEPRPPRPAEPSLCETCPYSSVSRKDYVDADIAAPAV